MRDSTSHVERHAACPRCRKHGKDKTGNNLAIYSDGHSWCFACKYYGHPPQSIARLKQRLQTQEQPHDQSQPIAYDWQRDHITARLPARARTWLDAYGITDRECIRHRLFYDLGRDLLVLPIFSEDDPDRLVVTCSRYFGHDPKHPKYLTHGNKSTHFKLVRPAVESPVLVFVEDILSAIKVGRCFNSIPLLGTSASDRILAATTSHYPVLRFWLDSNASGEATRQAGRTRQFHSNCGTIFTLKDPKDYSTEDIRRIINETLAPELKEDHAA
jgi:hypothetical protein